MEAQDILEANTLIAIFDGYKFYCNDSVNGSNGVYRKKNKIGMLKTDFKYDTSWSWLIPVLEKIGLLGYSVNISINHSCEIWKPNYEPNISFRYLGQNTKICVYKSIIDFIKWYNTTLNK